MTNLINLIDNTMRNASLKQYLYIMFMTVMAAMIIGTVFGVASALIHIETAKKFPVEITYSTPAPSQECQDDYNEYTKASLLRVYDNAVVVPYIDPVCKKQGDDYTRHLVRSVYR